MTNAIDALVNGIFWDGPAYFFLTGTQISLR